MVNIVVLTRETPILNPRHIRRLSSLELDNLLINTMTGRWSIVRMAAIAAPQCVDLIKHLHHVPRHTRCGQVGENGTFRHGLLA